MHDACNLCRAGSTTVVEQGEFVDVRRVTGAGAVALLAAVLGACDSSGEAPSTPGLEARGTVLTTVKPKRQDLSNKISLTGSVTINPVFGIVAPADGELRYLDKKPSTVAAVRPKWVATVWATSTIIAAYSRSSRASSSISQP